MRPNMHLLLGCLLGLLGGFLAGCGGGVESPRPRPEVPGISGSTSPIAPAAETARAEEIDYRGWRAFRLTNGMATLVAVPAIGGRLVEYKLGGHPFLWINPAELGKTYPPAQTEAERRWHNFGGYRLWPIGSARWNGPPDPLGSVIDEGAWTGKILVPAGRHVELELRSPEDKIVGVQIARTIRLYGGSTLVRITERITNITDETLALAFAGIAQLPASVEQGEKFSEKARLYLPLNPESRFQEGYLLLSPAGGGNQLSVLPNRLLRISAMGQPLRLGADSFAGWLAYVDEAHDYAFVQRFQPSKLGDYPEREANVLLEINSEPAYLQTTICGPVRALRPGETYEFALEWAATRLSGPIVNVTDVAAIQQPLQLEQTDGKLKLVGVLGVFQPGQLALMLEDAEGKPIGQPLLVQASPAQIVRLQQTLPAEPRAKRLRIVLQNASGTPLGEIAQLRLSPSLAAAPKP